MSSSRLSALLALLLALGGRAAAEGVPLEALSWSSDTTMPTATGMARRVQAYFLVDLQEDIARNNLYWNLVWNLTRKYEHNYQVLHVLVACNGDVPMKKENEDEWWDKAVDQSGSLVKTFAGDAYAALVLVDGSGKIVQVSRLGGNADSDLKDIEKLFPTAQPLVDNEGLFPLKCKPALKWLKLGDTKRAFKDAQKLGPDGAVLIKNVRDGADRLIDGDAKLITNASATSGAHFVAMQRLAKLLDEFPGTPAGGAATKALAQVRSDKQIANESAAWDMLQEYFKAMKKVPAKKVADMQRQWLPMITAKFGGTYAAEVATMIKKASKLDQ